MTAILLGALVGLVMGLTGAGGGILAVPLLVFGLHLPMAEAGPIGLLAVGLASSLGALAGLRLGIVRYRAALLVAAAGIAASPLGLWLASRLDTRTLSLAFAAVLLWVSYRHLAAANASTSAAPLPPGVPPCLRDAASGRFRWTTRCAAWLSLAGGMAGMLSGLLGVGGGFVMVPALQRATNLEMQSVVRTSLAIIALISLGGVGAAIGNGHFRPDAALPFTLGALGGMLAGGKLGSQLPGRYLKLAFGLVCAAVAAGMAARALGGV